MPITIRAASGRSADRGPLLATFVVNRADPTGLGRVYGDWTVADEGVARGFSVVVDAGDAAANGRLAAPDGRPPGFSGLEVVGGNYFSAATIPWFAAGVGAIVAVNGQRRLALRVTTDAARRTIVAWGADTRVAIGDTVRLCAAG